MVKINDSTELTLKGELEVYTCKTEEEVNMALDTGANLLFKKDNLVVNSARDVIVNLLRGETLDYRVSYISIGSGGDYDPTTGLDTGQRVGPAVTDTEMRQLSYRVPIVQTEDGANPYEWAFVAVARPEEAITPILNEFGVVTNNDTMLSHYITDADGGGKATQYVKSPLEYLVVRWTYRLELIVNGDAVEDPIAIGLTIETLTDTGAEGQLTAFAEVLAGSNTELAFPVLESDGTDGTLDVQADGTILAEDSDGFAAVLSLTTIS